MRTKSFIITISLIVFTFNSWAEKVPVEKALQAAAISYGQAGKMQLRSAGQQVLTLAYTNEYYYVFNIENDGGFIVVAGDDRAYPVLGYSLKGNFDEKNAPPVFLLWLQNYENEIATAIKEKPELPADPAWSDTDMETLIRSIELRQAVGPLGTAEWYQGNPYNLQCPLFGNNRTVTGCTATAMAIIMKYHADNGFKAVGTGSHSYKWNGQTLKVDFGTYDYDNMPKTTSSFVNNTQREAVARLMYHCGVSIESNYGVGGTEASPYDVLVSLASNFGYNPQMEYLWKSNFTDVNWKSLLKTEIDNRRPVYYAGWGNAGHAFICEGYTDNDEYYINWGWGGSSNGYFRLSALNTGIYHFNTTQAMIIGIKKAEGNPDAYSSLRLTSSGGYKGMSKNVEDVIQNQQFSVMAGAVSNTSFSNFSGSIGVAVYDGAGKLKEVLSKTHQPYLSPGYYLDNPTYSCKITQSIEVGDVLRLVSSTDGDKTWKIILGGSGVVDSLPVMTIVPVTSVALDVQGKTLTVGETVQLTVTVKPDNATNKSVSWSSGNTTVAEVSASGLVTAKAPGTATITVTTADGNKTATCMVTVTAPSVPTDGLVAYFPFNGNVNDVSGNGNHGTVRDATLTMDRFGNANRAYSFGGGSDYYNPSFYVNPKNQLPEYTLSLWFNIFEISVSKSTMFEFLYISEGGSHIPMMFFPFIYQNESEKCFWYFYECGEFHDGFMYGFSPLRAFYFPDIPISINEWAHLSIRITKDYSTIMISHNNKHDGLNLSTPIPHKSNNIKFSLGMSIQNDGGTFNGILDDVRIYNRVLSDAEITALYMEGVTSSHTYSTQIGGDSITFNESEISVIQSYIQNEILSVNSPEPEEVTIYSLSGSILYQTKKPAGKATFHVGNLPRGVLIVRGSSGWTQKVIKN